MKRTKTDRTLKVNVTVKIDGEPLDLKFKAPSATMRPIKMLPVFRSVCRDIVEWSVAKVEREGRSVSCRSGCAACCRHMIPVSKSEARRLTEIINTMPEKPRRVMKEKFSSAIRSFEGSAILEELRDPKKPMGTAYRTLGLAYLNKYVACPFLENEACTIYDERPLVCREYLVTSPPENCSRTNGLPIDVVRLPLRVSEAVSAIEDDELGFSNWIPLILALEFAESESTQPTPSPGAEFVEKFVSRLVGKESIAERS